MKFNHDMCASLHISELLNYSALFVKGDPCVLNLIQLDFWFF